MRTLIVLLIAVTSIVLGRGSAVEALSVSIRLVPVLSGLVLPVFVTHAGDGSGRLFVVEQPGVIEVVAPGSAAPTLFLDISAKVFVEGERGCSVSHSIPGSRLTSGCSSTTRASPTPRP